MSRQLQNSGQLQNNCVNVVTVETFHFWIEWSKRLKECINNRINNQIHYSHEKVHSSIVLSSFNPNLRSGWSLWEFVLRWGKLRSLTPPPPPPPPPLKKKNQSNNSRMKKDVQSGFADLAQKINLKHLLSKPNILKSTFSFRFYFVKLPTNRNKVSIAKA